MNRNDQLRQIRTSFIMKLKKLRDDFFEDIFALRRKKDKVRIQEIREELKKIK